MKVLRSLALIASLMTVLPASAGEYVTRSSAGNSTIQFLDIKGSVVGEYTDFVGGIHYTDEDLVHAVHIVMKTEGFHSRTGLTLAKHFPKAAFSTGSVVHDKGEITLRGNLTLQGKAAPGEMKMVSVEADTTDTIRTILTMKVDPATHDLKPVITTLRFQLVGNLLKPKK